MLSLTPNMSMGSVAAGSTVTVSGTGLLPNTAWSLELHSTPLVLMSGTTDSSGNFSGTGSIPAGIEAGQHRLILTGTSSGGGALTRTVYFTVSTTGSLTYLSTDHAELSASALAVTGVNVSGLIVFAGAAFGIGIALRMRSRAQAR